MDNFEKRPTHIKGLIGELEFSSHLIKKGWNIFVPLNQNSRIDMIIEKEGKLMKIQVKYCALSGGCIKVDLEHRTRKTKHFAKGELDSVGVYEPVNRKFYLIPFDKIFPRQGIWLRIDNSQNSQKVGINWAKEFEI